jgi:hypothetical protein
MACPSNTYKAQDDTNSISRGCESCSYSVSSDRTKCNKPAPCSRGQEWAVAAPGVCVPCEDSTFFKDTHDENESNPTKCIRCPDIGPGKFQNTRASR